MVEGGGEAGHPVARVPAVAAFDESCGQRAECLVADEGEDFGAEVGFGDAPFAVEPGRCVGETESDPDGQLGAGAWVQRGQLSLGGAVNVGGERAGREVLDVALAVLTNGYRTPYGTKVPLITRSSSRTCRSLVKVRVKIMRQPPGTAGQRPRGAALCP